MGQLVGLPADEHGLSFRTGPRADGVGGVALLLGGQHDVHPDGKGQRAAVAFLQNLGGGVKPHPYAAREIGSISGKPRVRVIVRGPGLAAAGGLEAQRGDPARRAAGFADLLEDGGGDVGRPLGIHGALALGDGEARLALGIRNVVNDVRSGAHAAVGEDAVGAGDVQRGGLPRAQVKGRGAGNIPVEARQLGGLDDVGQPGPVADAHGHGVAGKDEAEGGRLHAPVRAVRIAGGPVGGSAYLPVGDPVV